MRQLIKTTILVLFISLMLTNACIFVAGIKSSNEVGRMETQLDKLKQENIELENQLSHVNSLEYAASVAASFNFDKKAVPTYLDGLKYALNR